MSLDTKYRPINFADVLGQENTVKILRQFIASKTGFRQSYLFAGAYGGGKTTTARILARGLLCDNPTPEGDPCDQCPTCLSLINNGSAIDFIEFDAATHSGKADILKITEDLDYASFSGKRKIYLIDESHSLSKEALDGLLKPLEENIVGTLDKKLVCIFCTTEPEKMRATILSRCAPTFIIRPVDPEIVAKRLEMICQKENLEYDFEMLRLIAEMTECHIRDALKAIEGVSMLGAINKENVMGYLHLDMHGLYLDLLENISLDMNKAMLVAKEILTRVSPVTCYEKLAEISLLIYQMTIGSVKAPSYWDANRLTQIGDKLGVSLLGYASRFASRPARPSESMLLCDIGQLHFGGVSGNPATIVYMPAPTVPVIENVEKTTPIQKNVVQTPKTNGNIIKPSATIPGDVSFNQKAVRKYGVVESGSDVKTQDKFDLQSFCHLLALQIVEKIGGNKNGSTGRNHLGSPRIDVSGRSES
jgi:DNA polymerase-3 subunit gamma/tau